MTLEEALELAREVQRGKTRSYVRAAQQLSDFLLERQLAIEHSKENPVHAWYMLKSAVEGGRDV